ncbi:hypothetical protein [Jannaschia marina]|uniref:hypothetical protein n=1 Tax=Jannaschia marina TaxID=2741674 RepID=UPI0015CA48AF|nr:hypothetical protein [Jannaschia marina]
MTAVRLRAPVAHPSIDDIIARHGPRRVLLAALRALLRPRARPPDVRYLSNHVRRDIGLDPLEPRQSPRYLP